MIRKYRALKWYSRPTLLFYGWSLLLGGCSVAARPDGMIPASFNIVKAHPQTVRVTVTGGHESVAVGRPQITDGAFREALVTSITRSKSFAKVIEDQNPSEDYRLTVTLFALDKRVFGQAVKLEAGWTLRRAATEAVVWQESIVTQSTDSNFQVATEVAAKDNIAAALGKISKLDLQ